MTTQVYQLDDIQQITIDDAGKYRHLIAKYNIDDAIFESEAIDLVKRYNPALMGKLFPMAKWAAYEGV
jgi:hypothetical protein